MWRNWAGSVRIEALELTERRRYDGRKPVSIICTFRENLNLLPNWVTKILENIEVLFEPGTLMVFSRGIVNHRLFTKPEKPGEKRYFRAWIFAESAR
jgi:hypothetical protein